MAFSISAFSGVYRRGRIWGRRFGLMRKAAIVLTVCALLSVAATYLSVIGVPPMGPDPHSLLILLNLDLAFILALGVLVVIRIGALWRQRRQGRAGSQLQLRLVSLFGLVALAPTIVVAVVATLFFEVAIESWFSNLVKGAVENSRAVAEAYLFEHEELIRGDAVAMAGDLTRDPTLLYGNSQKLAQTVIVMSAARSLREVVVFDTSGRIRARSGIAFGLENEPVPAWALERARSGQVAVMTGDREDTVRGLIMLDRISDTFLYVARAVDPRVISYVQQTRRALKDYRTQEGQRSGIQVTFVVIFAMLALLLVMAATWIGLNVASRLGHPIAGLIAAAERVRSGDLSARVEEEDVKDELGSLTRAFNRMTGQLATQRADLVEANRQLDDRRRFMETVLAGVSAGVIGLDRFGRINLPNRPASELLATDLDLHIGFELAQLVPEMTELLETALRRPDRRNEAQIKIVRGKRPRTLLSRVTAEMIEGEVRGFVVTLDDITELMNAQRTAAWADVARRIAHEIKNPLTPIQLSAERLKRKYAKEITSDPETFAICTDTIVRQVGDIGRMVDEFSAFARMPAPVMKTEDLGRLARESAFLLRSANPEIDITLDIPDSVLPIQCDGRQIGQSLINLLQNAVDAIAGRAEMADHPLPPGRIALRIEQTGSATRVEIIDNGKGLPVQERDRLTEPYMTTRAKGTGLGLAIVKKIMEDHSGELTFDDAPGGGAIVTMVLSGPATTPTATDTGETTEKAMATYGS